MLSKQGVTVIKGIPMQPVVTISDGTGVPYKRLRSIALCRRPSQNPVRRAWLGYFAGFFELKLTYDPDYTIGFCRASTAL